MSIVVRGEEKALIVFNTNTSDTAFISGNELEVLHNWILTGKTTAFIQRLKKYNIIDHDRPKHWLDEIEKAERIIVPLRSFCAPESVHIELTSRCNLNCPQCYKDRTDSADLSYERLKQIIRQSSKMKVFQIAFGGGEPLLYPYLIEAVSECSSLNLVSTITTSGDGLSDELLAKLIGSGVKHIQVSLNGSTKLVHNKSREGFETAINALSLLSKTKLSYGINWVARKENIDDFECIIALAKSLEVDNINVLRYKPSQTENYNSYSLNMYETQNLKNIISNCSGVKIKLDSAYSNLLCNLNNKSGCLSGCGAGRRFIAVDCYGNFKPCSHINISDDGENLEYYWYNSSNLNLFRTVEENVCEPCKSCKYLWGCRGCRAICIQQFGDIFAGDKSCQL